MSGGDDWQAGDLALCVRGGRGDLSVTRVGGVWHRESNAVVRKGAVYTVRVTKLFVDADPVVLALGLEEVDGPWLASRFIKVTPREADEFDRETIALLTGKPARTNA